MRCGSILAFLSAYCWLDPRIPRLVRLIEPLVAGFAVEATSAEEKSRFTVTRYDAADHSRGSELFDWERPWFVRRLPPPPARVLLCACGAGRELRWLLDAGY